MCVCVYIYICVCVYVYIYVYIYPHARARVYAKNCTIIRHNNEQSVINLLHVSELLGHPQLHIQQIKIQQWPVIIQKYSTIIQMKHRISILLNNVMQLKQSYLFLTVSLLYTFRVFFALIIKSTIKTVDAIIGTVHVSVWCGLNFTSEINSRPWTSFNGFQPHRHRHMNCNCDCIYSFNCTPDDGCRKYLKHLE
jgi:hypothetical protein